MELVEGEWKGFSFSRATEEDVEEMAELMRDQFFPDEPMTRLLGYSQELEDDFRKIWSQFPKDDLSFCVRDVQSQKMVGLRIIFEHNKDLDWAQFNFSAPQTKKLLCCNKALDDQANLKEKYNLDTYADLCFTTVHRDFRGRGLATEMYRRATELARAQGYFLAKACFSSPFSRAAAARVGFKQVASITIAETKDANGEPISENATDEMMTQAIYIL